MIESRPSRTTREAKIADDQDGIEPMSPKRRKASEISLASLIPICVDLDNTLIRTDLLWETAILLLRESPWNFVKVLGRNAWSRAALKRDIAARVKLNPALLPYNEDLVEWLRWQKSRGRNLMLATAADYQLANGVAEHLDLFDEIVASNGVTNNKGSEKLNELRWRYGNKFVYVGDSKADLPIWKNCEEAILVNPSRRLEAIARTTANVTGVFRDDVSKPRELLRAIRVHQWVKNLLVFIPLISSHQILHAALLMRAAAAFLSFGLCASSMYLLNDILDIQADRQHLTKKRRPFASGRLHLWHAVVLMPTMLAASLLIAICLSASFTVVLLLYLFLTCAYSFRLKRMLLVDVFTLAALYSLRIVAGATSYNVSLSSWLLAFSGFLFLSLGFCKRAAEMTNLVKSGRAEAAGRAYQASDLSQINVFGVASGFISALVLALYTSSENVRTLYRNKDVLWLLCPLVLYWLSRTWLITSRGLMNEDPIVFAAKDRVTYLVLLLMLCVMLFATLSPEFRAP